MPSKVAFTAENLEYLVKRYSDDIALFAQEILGIKKLDEWQRWYCNATLTKGKGGKKVAIASCHSSGKTMFSSVIALHRLLCYPESHIIITSATASQLKAAFHGTLQKIVDNSIITNWFDVQAETVKLKGVADSWIRLQPWSVSRPEAFAGIHCASPCFIADESSAIDELIFQSWDGNMMHPNSLLVLLGNPIHRRGELYNAFHDKKDFFETAFVSAYDSSFISKQWIEEMKATYGEDSDVFRVRVLGEFPKIDTDTFIPEALLRSAVNRAVLPQTSMPVVAGIDIGQFRDQSSMCIRQGNKVLAILKWNSRDLMVVAENIHRAIIQYNVRLACIDGNGIGSGVADRLQQLCPEKTFRFKFQNYPTTERMWFNSRTKYWGMVKKWLETGSIPEDKDLLKEGPSLLYTYDKYGRFQLESKELAARRGVDSPDIFDSLAYSFAANPDMSIRASMTSSEESGNRYDTIEISWH